MDQEGEWKGEQETKAGTWSDDRFALHLLFSMSLAQQEVMFFFEMVWPRAVAAQDRILRFYTQRGAAVLCAAIRIPLYLDLPFCAKALVRLWPNSYV